MNVNFGLFPPLVPPPLTKDQRKPALVARARSDLAAWMGA
jgi:methylenetetrahydrofolate--tRNA-(uracil-5-)-methyltransferase